MPGRQCGFDYAIPGIERRNHRPHQDEAASVTIDYATDFDAWTRRTAQLLRDRRWQDLDADRLAEEIDDLGKSEKRSISSQLTRLLLHVLKWQHQPQRRSDSWLDSISDARLQILLAIEDSPGLRHYPETQLATAYQRARRGAARQTGLPPSKFPTLCPHRPEQLMTEDWLPD